MTLARDHAPAFNGPAPRRAVRAHVRGAARACATLPTTAFGAPCANVGARSASAPFVAGHRGFIDDVIMPRATRKRICRSLSMLRDKRLENPWRKHNTMPL